MIELLTLIILISLFCNGLFYITTEEGMPLKWLDKWIDKTIKKRGEKRDLTIDKSWPHAEQERAIKRYAHRWLFLYSPILGCITCMSSVWGTLLYWHFIGFTTESYYELPIVVISSAYLNTLMFNYVRKY